MLKHDSVSILFFHNILKEDLYWFKIVLFRSDIRPENTNRSSKIVRDCLNHLAKKLYAYIHQIFGLLKATVRERLKDFKGKIDLIIMI